MEGGGLMSSKPMKRIELDCGATYDMGNKVLPAGTTVYVAADVEAVLKLVEGLPKVEGKIESINENVWANGHILFACYSQREADALAKLLAWRKGRNHERV